MGTTSWQIGQYSCVCIRGKKFGCQNSFHHGIDPPALDILKKANICLKKEKGNITFVYTWDSLVGTYFPRSNLWFRILSEVNWLFHDTCRIFTHPIKCERKLYWFKSYENAVSHLIAKVRHAYYEVVIISNCHLLNDKSR